MAGGCGWPQRLVVARKMYLYYAHRSPPGRGNADHCFAPQSVCDRFGGVGLYCGPATVSSVSSRNIVFHLDEIVYLL